jgi:hypothetical protein
MTIPHPSPTVPGSGSVLDGDPRILIPCPRPPSGWESPGGRPTSWPAPGGSRPPAWAPVTCMSRPRCCGASSTKASPQQPKGRGSREIP